jgi:hypothetical protein
MVLRLMFGRLSFDERCSTMSKFATETSMPFLDVLIQFVLTSEPNSVVLAAIKGALVNGLGRVLCLNMSVEIRFPGKWFVVGAVWGGTPDVCQKMSFKMLSESGRGFEVSARFLRTTSRPLTLEILAAYGCIAQYFTMLDLVRFQCRRREKFHWHLSQLQFSVIALRDG